MAVPHAPRILALLATPWRRGAGWQLIIVLLLLAWAPAQAKRVALLIGNAAYADAPLRNPVNDATDLATRLRSLGFEVTVQTDRNRDLPPSSRSNLK